MNNEEFINALKNLEIKITKKQISDLNKYYNLLIEYNSHTNLTRITKEKEVYLKHFYDSLTLIKAVKLNNQSLLDIGTGAGFPGVVLKIFFPQLKVTLVDSLNKRITFLNMVIKKLNLNNIKAVHIRAEEYIKNNREQFDIVTSRAVANLNMLSELCIPYVKENGYFIAMKSNIKEELDCSKNIIELLGGKIDKVISFKLYNNIDQRSLIVIKKIIKTSDKFPRKFNEIKKNPL